MILIKERLSVVQALSTQTSVPRITSKLPLIYALIIYSSANYYLQSLWFPIRYLFYKLLLLIPRHIKQDQRSTGRLSVTQFQSISISPSFQSIIYRK